jgi:hypothetical protein
MLRTSLEDLTRGALQVMDSDRARANKALLERHFAAEWASDIEGTMATIHPHDPWQSIPALGVAVRGFAAVRDYYLARFASWPGQAMDWFDRTTVTDSCIIVEGRLNVRPSGDFGGLRAAGATLSAPCVIVVDCRDGFILGETVYVDGAALRGQAGGGR